MLTTIMADEEKEVSDGTDLAAPVEITEPDTDPVESDAAGQLAAA